jgi:hypothetical protein
MEGKYEMMDGIKLTGKRTAAYWKTGILGSYETAECDDYAERDGKYAPCFDDSLVILGSDTVQTLRCMVIGGKAFRVNSIFPAKDAATPTERLLQLVDADLAKESERG